jgi:hypothetical protein
MLVYTVEWCCKLCGQTHSFLKEISDLDGWPNKLDDMRCENEDCGQVQDVPLRSCTVTEVGN